MAWPEKAKVVLPEKKEREDEDDLGGRERMERKRSERTNERQISAK